MSHTEAVMQQQKQEAINKLQPGPYHPDDLQELLLTVQELVRIFNRGENVSGTSYIADALKWHFRPFKKN